MSISTPRVNVKGKQPGQKQLQHLRSAVRAYRIKPGVRVTRYLAGQGSFHSRTIDWEARSRVFFLAPKRVAIVFREELRGAMLKQLGASFSVESGAGNRKEGFLRWRRRGGLNVEAAGIQGRQVR